jgi:hypothetical protein
MAVRPSFFGVLPKAKLHTGVCYANSMHCRKMGNRNGALLRKCQGAALIGNAGAGRAGERVAGMTKGESKGFRDPGEHNEYACSEGTASMDAG